MCEHPDQEKYKARAFSGENLEKVMDALSEQRNSLTKADFFAQDDEGKYLIDTPGFWRNFDKVLAIVNKSGDKFTMDDFRKPLGAADDARTLLDSARQHEGLGKIFKAEVWEGRFDEMERLWYYVPTPSRRQLFQNDGKLDSGLKRNLLQAEGREMPEDRLAKAGLTPHDVYQAFTERGNYEDVARRLSQAGDWMRKEYLLLPDKDGYTAFYEQGAWDRYNDLHKRMQGRGEQFEVADFIRQTGYGSNMLTRAYERNALQHVFAADHWVDRLPEMTSLWSKVLSGWKTGSFTVREFDKSYAEAESLTYGKLVDFNRFESKGALLRPLNPDAAAAGTEKPVLPIGLKSFWDNIDTVQQKVANMGARLTLADLRQNSGELEESCLISAVKFGRFNELQDIARKAGEKISLDDFLSKDRHGNPLLNILAERGELNQVFQPEIWAGRLGEMKTLWTQVRISDRTQVDFDQVEVAAQQATLQQKVGDDFKFKLKPRKPGK
ncbi:MAG: hypothetical protein RBS08_07230 [Bdellovibrionales bacterium]|nr:hypothetical protein [Bdellovibrionales bacterium]